MSKATASEGSAQAPLRDEMNRVINSKPAAQAHLHCETTDQVSPRQRESNSGNARSNESSAIYSAPYTMTGELISRSAITEIHMTMVLIPSDSEERALSISSIGSHYRIVSESTVEERSQSESSLHGDHDEEAFKETLDAEWSDFDDPSYEGGDEEWSRLDDGHYDDDDDDEGSEEHDLELHPHLLERISRVVHPPSLRHKHPRRYHDKQSR